MLDYLAAGSNEGAEDAATCELLQVDGGCL